MIVTCAIKHIHWRLALTELSLLLTEWPKWLGSPHMPADLFCQRQCADKACLVPSHHCGHARTRKAEDAVQQSHYLALVPLVGALEEELHRASSSTFVHYDCGLICKYFDYFWFWSSLLFKTAPVFFLLNLQASSRRRSPVLNGSGLGSVRCNLVFALCRNKVASPDSVKVPWSKVNSNSDSFCSGLNFNLV